MKLIHLSLIILYLTFISNVNGKKHKKADSCKKFLNLFKQNNTFFIDCSMAHSVPVSFCLNCHQEYTNMTESYSNLYNGVEDVKIDNKTVERNCKEQYFDLDALNLIQNIYQSSVGLWNAASCSKCFDNDDVSANAKLIIHESELLDNCIIKEETTNASLVCDTCKKMYLDLNNNYDKIKTQTCFDIEDLMNRTQHNWSSNLKCCKEKENTPKTLIIAVSSTLSSCVVLFYAGFFIYMRRRRQYEIITSPADSAADEQTVTQPSILPANQSPHRHEANEPTYDDMDYNEKSKYLDKQNPSNNDEDDSSDDEPIIHQGTINNTKVKTFDKKSNKNISKSAADSHLIEI